MRLARILLALSSAAAIPMFAEITAAPFGETPAGEKVQIFTLSNGSGFEARIMTYGGIIVSLKSPDNNGDYSDVVHGFDSLDGYLAEHPYFGALIGRYGNRIARGRFTLDGRTYSLATNNDANHLHGGLQGFDKVVWAAKPFETDDGPGLELTYLSPDGDQGYPGELAAKVTYTLGDAELRIDYHATTNKPTVLNLTNHSYFNLKDGGRSTILDHELTIEADHYTPIDPTSIPTGQPTSVRETPFDFREPTKIGARIEQKNEQLANGLGYDHNWVLRRSTSKELELAARLYEASTGRVMEVLTTEPGVQFYSGNFLDGSVTGKGGVKYQQRSALCLETQHFPDSPNQEAFPSTVLRPGESYDTTTIFRFSAMK